MGPCRNTRAVAAWPVSADGKITDFCDSAERTGCCRRSVSVLCFQGVRAAESREILLFWKDNMNVLHPLAMDCLSGSTSHLKVGTAALFQGQSQEDCCRGPHCSTQHPGVVRWCGPRLVGIAAGRQQPSTPWPGAATLASQTEQPPHRPPNDAKMIAHTKTGFPFVTVQKAKLYPLTI